METAESFDLKAARAVRTLSGARNPVHTGHVQMLEAAAAALTAAGRHHAVLFGFLAPSSEGYLQHKLGAEALAALAPEPAAAAPVKTPTMTAAVCMPPRRRRRQRRPCR